VTWSHPLSENDRQQSVTNFQCSILYNPIAELRHLPMMKVLAAFKGKILGVDSATPQTARQYRVNRLSTENQHSVNRVSTECQRFLVFNYVKSKGSAIACTHNQDIGIRSEQKRSRCGHSTSLKMSVNRESTILWVASCIVLATGPGNLAAVRVLTGGSVQFSLIPGQKPDLHWLGEFVTRSRHKTAVFWPGCTRTTVPFCGSSHFRSN
jgi:hypothetical protein